MIPPDRTADGFTTPTSLRAALSDRYAVERELGRGGMATVYLARDLRHDRAVAVKVLDQSIGLAGAERFLREIRFASQLTHPHVLGVHDSGESGGVLYYVMPYVDGETLRTRLARDGALSVADVMRLMRELADALAYAHAQGVMHRDLKPENVLLSAGHAVVADFGIAKAIAAAAEGGDTPATRLTSTGVAIGTPAYMAPEQMVGDAGANQRADLYALGVIAYEMLTGSHPFAGRTAQALAAAHLTETPASLAERRRDVPPALAGLVMRLLAKDPDARPQSAGDVVRTLDGMSTASIERRRGKRGAMIGIAAALLLVVVAAGGYSWWRGTSRRVSGPVEIHTAAVLPFLNTSGSSGDDYFSDGLTDELAHALGRVPGLRLAGRTSSYAFKGKTVTAQEIGRALDVAAIVSGTVRRAGERLRVTTQLVSTADGKVMWDSVYESRSSDVFALQDELTRAIAAAIAPALRGAGRASDARVVDVKRGTADQEAYELYLKGHYYWLQRGAPNLLRAATYFQQAIASDPKFARAYAGLSMTYSVLPNFAPDPADSLPKLAKANAERAVALDSTLGEAHGALGVAVDGELHFGDGVAQQRMFVALDPSNTSAHHWLGMSLLNLGRTDEAIPELARAREADPLALSSSSAYSTALEFARRFPESIAAARYVLTLDSTFHYALLTLGLSQTLGGRPDSGVITLEKTVRLHPDDSRMQGALLFAYAAAGRWPDARRLREQLHRPGGDQFDGIEAAFADVVFGDREPLIRVLSSEAGMRRYQKYGGIVGCNPLFDPLWSDARFRAAMQRLTIEPCPLVRPWPFAPGQRSR